MRTNKHTILVGEGIHQHTVYGEAVYETISDVTYIDVLEDALLKHEKPNGSFGEHKTLTIEQGKYVQGMQVEYNPFNGTVSRVWD